jgi:hypothetical protein
VTMKKIGLVAMFAFAFAFSLVLTPQAIAACAPSCQSQCDIKRNYRRDVRLGGFKYSVDHLACTRLCNNGCNV